MSAKVTPTVTFSPSLGLSDTKKMLEELISAYTSPEFQKKLFEEHRAADFEERRVLFRARKLIPHVMEPILTTYGFVKGDYQSNKREMERVVTHWRQLDEEVNLLAKECLNCIMGDVSD